MTMAQQSFSCTRCNNSIIIASGQYTCNTCGLVHGPEMINPQIFEERHHAGERIHLIDGLGSYVGYFNGPFSRDSKGHWVSIEARALFGRVRKMYQYSTKFCRAETLYRSLCSLNRVVSILDLNGSISKRAAYLFRKFVITKNSLNSKVTNHIVSIAGSLFIAIREAKIPYRMKEIAQTFYELGHRVNTTTLMREVYEISRTLKIPYTRAKSCDFIIRVLTEAFQFPDFIKNMELKDFEPFFYQRELLDWTMKALDYLKGKLKKSLNPFVFAISLIYYIDRLYCREIITMKSKRQVFNQLKLARLFTIAEYSIRSHCKELKAIIPNLEVLDEQC